MNNNELIVDYQQLIQALQVFCENGSTGTMFITTDEKHSVRFVLKKGKIISFAYRSQYGDDALCLIQKIRSGIFSFKQDVLLYGENDRTQLETNTLLGKLFGIEVSTLLDNIGPFNDEIKYIRTTLSVFIGPIAEFICDKYQKEHGEPNSQLALEKMITIVSREISDKKDKALFKKQVEGRLTIAD